MPFELFDLEAEPAAASPADFEVWITRACVTVRVETFEVVAPVVSPAPEPLFAAEGPERTTAGNGAFALCPAELACEETERGPAIAAPATRSATPSSPKGPGPIRFTKCMNIATAETSAASDGNREASGMKAVWVAVKSPSRGT